jgi:Ras-related protein Rab-2A
MNSAAENYPLFKFIIIGESGVGKSCFLLRYTKDEFASDYNVTIGVEFQSKLVSIDENTKIKLQIWVITLFLNF